MQNKTKSQKRYHTFNKAAWKQVSYCWCKAGKVTYFLQQSLHSNLNWTSWLGDTYGRGCIHVYFTWKVLRDRYKNI